MKLKNTLPFLILVTIIFLAGCTKNVDNTATPVVIATDPFNTSTNIAINNKIKVTFSETMDPATITASTFTVKEGPTTVLGAVTYSGQEATFNSDFNLISNKLYIGTITTGAKNLAGKSLKRNYTFSFTTDINQTIIVPTLTSVDPEDNTIGVDLNKVISITFNKPMDPLTIDNSSFALMHGTNEVPGIVAYSGITATFTPLNNLENGKKYTTIISNSVKDTDGNRLAFTTVWSFKTTIVK